MEQREDPTAPARVATSPQADVDQEAAMPLEDEARIAKTTSSRRPVTLHQLSFREHSVQNLTAVGRFDRLCLRFLKFIVARRVLAFLMPRSPGTPPRSAPMDHRRFRRRFRRRRGNCSC